MFERIVVASPGAWRFPSTDARLGPFIRSGAWPVEVMSVGYFPERSEVEALTARGGSRTALVLQRVMPSRDDMQALHTAYDWIAFDLDDAIYAVIPQVLGSKLTKRLKRLARMVVRGSPTASGRKRPLARTLKEVDVCVVGNSILADFARRYAPRVEEIPTTVEPLEAPPTAKASAPVAVWMGVGANLQHLEVLREPLEELHRLVDFRLRVVSSDTWANAPVPVEFVPWSKEAARAALLTSTVGLAPLTDDPFTRGKCATRSIVYGGHALPTVASPVGITHRVVLDGRTGYLAPSSRDWIEPLRKLLTDSDSAARMGASALDHIRANYSDEIAVRRWRELFARG